MKYYISNYIEKDSKDQGTFIPSSLMELNDALEIYFKLRSDWENAKRNWLPILHDENGAEIVNIIEEVAGEEVTTPFQFLIRMEMMNVMTGEIVTEYITNGNLFCIDEVTAMSIALTMFNLRERNEDFVLSGLQIIN